MKDIIEKYYETKEFPANLCTIPDAKEAGVINSETVFECVIADKDFPHLYRIERCTPYLAKDLYGPDLEHYLFGWASTTFNSWVDHFENNVHDDGEVVIAWRKVEKENL